MKALTVGFALFLPLSSVAEVLPDGKYEGRGDGTRAIMNVSGSSASVSVAGTGCVGGVEGRVSASGDGWTISDGVCSLQVGKSSSSYSFLPATGGESACEAYHGQGCHLIADVKLTRPVVSGEDSAGGGSVAKSARCELVVAGATHGKGNCQFYHEAGGSFQIHFKSGVFADVRVEGAGKAVGYWTGPQPASHAHEDLGRLSQEGACWVNDKARVCAW